MRLLFALLRPFDRALAGVARLIIRGYQLVLSPLIHAIGGPAAGCRHEPSCSRYALECYRRHNVLRATGYTLRRIVRCNPLVEGGYDPVPPPRPRRGSPS